MTGADAVAGRTCSHRFAERAPTGATCSVGSPATWRAPRGPSPTRGDGSGSLPAPRECENDCRAACRRTGARPTQRRTVRPLLLGTSGRRPRGGLAVPAPSPPRLDSVRGHRDDPKDVTGRATGFVPKSARSRLSYSPVALTTAASSGPESAVSRASASAEG